MIKYKEYYQRMVENNKELFDLFQKIHDQYTLNPDPNQEALNQIGGKIWTVIREWEGKLCRQSEIGGYGKFTSNLAEKFQGEIRTHFPNINSVGIIKKTPFQIKKINPF